MAVQISPRVWRVAHAALSLGVMFAALFVGAASFQA